MYSHLTIRSSSRNSSGPEISRRYGICARKRHASMGPGSIDFRRASGRRDRPQVTQRTVVDGCAVRRPEGSVAGAKTHTGNFFQGQTNAIYTVTVSNSVSADPTSGVVTITEAPPPGLTLV